MYQNGELLYEEGGDKETASCHLGAGIEAVRRGQRTYYYHPDEQLSTALITDETGTIKNQYRYDAFGAGLEVSEELPNRIRYTGQQYDEVTEQYYLRARYYNPILGRFLQEDVYQGDGLNLYAYCRNNPVVYWDPSGYNEQPNKCGNTGKINDAFEDAENLPDDIVSLRDLMTLEEAERYDNYWKQGTGSYQVIEINGERVRVIVDGKNINTRQRMYTAPGTRSIVDVKLGSDAEMYYRETIFDEYGRKVGHNDYTDHGRPDVATHTNPHYHPNPVDNPSQHGKGVPGLHPQTPDKGEL